MSSQAGQNPTDELSLGDLRRELHRLMSMADSAERPKPTRINGPDHPMPGADGLVYVSTPESMYPGEDFVPMYTPDARRLAMALLAAADRADHQAAGIPRLEDRRNSKTRKRDQMT